MYFVLSSNKRAEIIIEKISRWIGKNDKILDIGCGEGTIAKKLINKGYQVTPLDVANKCRYPEIKPIIYDGKHLPFPNDSFDTTLLLTVLHHTSDPLMLIKEAKRVSKEIIIMEDVYTNFLEKMLTWIGCSLFNHEIVKHPHSNKRDEEWREAFDKLELKASTFCSYRQLFFFWPFRNVIYLLKR